MNAGDTGKAIAHLRKERGLTQRQLADILGISDKAISKWERGISSPDVTLLNQLAVVLDSDASTIIAGRVGETSVEWKGILYLDGSVPITADILGKPLVYLMLCYFALADIFEVAIVGRESDLAYVKTLLATDEIRKISVTYIFDDAMAKSSLMQFSTGAGIMEVRGCTFIYGVNFTMKIRAAKATHHSVTSLAVYDPMHATEVIRFDSYHKVVDRQDEAVESLKEYRYLPIRFYDIGMYSKCFGKANIFLSHEKFLHVQLLQRGTVCFELRNYDDIHVASSFVRMMRDMAGVKVYDLREILQYKKAGKHV